MTNGKNDRKKRFKKILTAIIIIILLVIAEEVITNWEQDITPQDNGQGISGQQTSNQSTGAQGQEVEGNLMLYMIDVGQADSFLFVQGNSVALIDCGTRSTGKDAVEYIKNLGITKIDYVFGTHPHDDHMGGMYDIITNFEIGKIILPRVEAGQVTANWYIKLMKEISEGKYQVQYSESGDTFNLGNAIINILWQSKVAESNVNNYSSIIKVSFGDMDIIMTGDAETDIEKQVLASNVNLDAEILKLGHHGSDTSTSNEFLDAITPDYGLISSKIGNKYDHPIKSTMQKLQSRKIEVYRTDESGDVVATITSNSVSFNCKPGDYLSGPELEERSAS